MYYTKIKDTELQIAASHTAKKQELYADFMKNIIEFIADPSKASDEKLSLEVRKKFMSNALLWSNPKVLTVYHKFRKDGQKKDSEPESTIDIASMFLAFREDLGLKNKGINEQTILEILYDEDDLKTFGLNFEDTKK